MQKIELAKSLAKKLDVSVNTAKTIISQLLEAIVRAIARGDKKVHVKLGTFVAKRPKTGEIIEIPGRKIIRFIIEMALKTAGNINNTKALLTRGFIHLDATPEEMKNNREITYLGNKKYWVVFTARRDDLPKDISFEMVNHLGEHFESMNKVEARYFCHDNSDICKCGILGEFASPSGDYDHYIVSRLNNDMKKEELLGVSFQNL